MAIVILLAYIGGLIYASVVCVQKGKTTMMVVSWFLCTPLIIVGACRIAKPNSSFAWKNYGEIDPMKQKISEMRFPKETYLMRQLSNADANTDPVS